MNFTVGRLLVTVLLASAVEFGYACSLAAWSSSSGTASPIVQARYDGSCGLRVDLAGTSAAFVEDATAAGLSPGVVDYVARFYLYLDDATLSGSDAVTVFTAYSSGMTELFGVEIASDGVDRYARVYARDDNGFRVQLGGFGPVLRSGWRAVEVQWTAATVAGGGDGQVSLSIDGGDGVETIGGLDTDTQTVGIARLGAVAGNSPTVAGAMDFDSFDAQRSGSPGLVTKSCSGGDVNLEDATFLSGPTGCTASLGIALGRRVVFDAGSVVTVTAPAMTLEPGIRILNGATVSFQH